MEPLELEIAIEELELRVERLRSLYEQYFMGIEKIPPSVVHKDVDRRIYTLRREQIRNTAKRFKLQTTIQRYNTFQQYWQRILREIENGTYKRHVLRAERSAAGTKPSNAEKPREVDSNLADGAPESENVASSRPRKSILPSAPRHSIPVNPRHSTLPPIEKVEAFTRALERDLAAALDGDLDFGRTHSKLGDLLELDDNPVEPRARPSPTSTVKPHLQGPTLPKPRPAVIPPDNRRLPPKAALSQSKNARPPPLATPPPRIREPPAIGIERVKQIHKDLVEAKAQTAEAGQVSLNALTRKLEATVKSLSEKHSGKKIDFAVVIKDGKAIVKPIIR